MLRSQIALTLFKNIVVIANLLKPRNGFNFGSATLDLTINLTLCF